MLWVVDFIDETSVAGRCVIKAMAKGRRVFMEWSKPEFIVVAVTMEVTAYAATK
jgi:coenzyme PQQ precursor peptide PqqA